jgi:hypothetical protein
MNDAERAHEGRSTTLSSTVEAHDTARCAPRAPSDRENAILQVVASATNMSLPPSLSFQFSFFVHVHSLACTSTLSCYSFLHTP